MRILRGVFGQWIEIDETIVVQVAISPLSST